MKFFVVVNQCYIVMVEANTNGGAEHKILDNLYYGITNAQAFAQEELTTETFAGFMQCCRTVSYDELRKMAADWKQADEGAKQEEAAMVELEKSIAELKRQLEIAEENLKTTAFNVRACKRNRDRAYI